jgi:four helix bundle protein
MGKHHVVPTQFDHERFEVYQRALDFVELAERIAKSLSSGRSHVVDQLRRAALSIPLNIAEGAGEYRPTEKNRFYRMAIRSATECAAILDVLQRLEPGCEAEAIQGRELLLRIVSMLIALCRSTERKSTG